MRITTSRKVPLTVVSGGISEIILASFYAIMFNGEILDGHKYLEEEHLKIIANSFKYENDFAVDYLRPIIHSMNKQDFLYTAESKLNNRKKNVLVMGDLVEDIQMVDEKEHDIVLKVGFLNSPERHASLIHKYEESFDMVITGDGSLAPVIQLLNDTFHLNENKFM